MTAEVGISSARTGIRGIGETTNFYKVGLAKKVLVLIHGIIGDTEGIAAVGHVPSLELFRGRRRPEGSGKD